VFRTYNASITLQIQLEKKTLPLEEKIENKVEFYDNANRQVAILCNHQKTVAKTFNATSEILQHQLKDLLKYLEELQEHVQTFKGKVKKTKKVESSKKSEEEDDKDKLKKVFPDNLEKTMKTIKNVEQKISKLEKKITSRDENKEIALNTSKLNYMDPRITVTWCKNNEVPIEKVFPKSVREKFPWAMYTDLNYKF
jgi:DNA topoisomerase-1